MGLWLLDLRVEKLINVSSDEAFLAFTDADLLSKWFTTNADVDLRIGGRYSNADGDEGEFIEIVPSQLLKFTWENKNHCPGTLVMVRFSDVSTKETRIEITHSDLKSKNDLTHMREGWLWSLDCVKSFLETGRTIRFEDWKKSN